MLLAPLHLSHSLHRILTSSTCVTGDYVMLLACYYLTSMCKMLICWRVNGRTVRYSLGVLLQVINADKKCIKLKSRDMFGLSSHRRTVFKVVWRINDGLPFYFYRRSPKASAMKGRSGDDERESLGELSGSGEIESVFFPRGKCYCPALTSYESLKYQLCLRCFLK